ncbi:MAG: haloalkane dehalogenase [Acetobacteraceae bacterium]
MKRNLQVLGRRMAYTETGQGPPVLFLHGNPTSSFLWRDVIPPVAAKARCIAPDLIGMGDSEKLAPADYDFATHSRFVDGFIDAAIAPDARLVLVLHDWGSALGFDWAHRHPDRVRGIAYMEAIVRPLSGWEEWNPDATRIFQGFRSEKGEEMILDRNLFIERVLPGSIIRTLTDAEMTEYRRPFLRSEHRAPTLAWPRAIPIGGEPADVVARVQAYAEWMAANAIAKLFVNADPGAILTGTQREFCRAWPNQTEITVPGKHFIQEDSGPAIGAAIAAWMDGLA